MKPEMNRRDERKCKSAKASLNRLNRGVQRADDKNLSDTLIMVDQLAFLVNVKNQTVITAMQSGDKANVFTNIDGTVIV